MDTFDTHIYTKDWHPEDHISFYDNVCQRDLDETSPITNCSEANLFDTVSTNDKICFYGRNQATILDVFHS